MFLVSDAKQIDYEFWSTHINYGAFCVITTKVNMMLTRISTKISITVKYLNQVEML